MVGPCGVVFLGKLELYGSVGDILIESSAACRLDRVCPAGHQSLSQALAPLGQGLFIFELFNEGDERAFSAVEHPHSAEAPPVLDRVVRPPDSRGDALEERVGEIGGLEGAVDVVPAQVRQLDTDGEFTPDEHGHLGGVGRAGMGDRGKIGAVL